jgi:hypothetical protein
VEMMDGATDAQDVRRRCAECKTELECCAMCERAECPRAVCERCLRLAFSRTRSDLGKHGH